MEAREESSATRKIDLDELLGRVDSDRELLFELFLLFKKELPKYFQGLEMAIDRDDIAQVAVMSHTLKGMLLNLAATDAADSASRLEQLARHEDRSSLKAAFAALEQDIEELLPEIDKYMTEAQS